jgi:hypothetical protein
MARRQASRRRSTATSRRRGRGPTAASPRLFKVATNLARDRARRKKPDQLRATRLEQRRRAAATPPRPRSACQEVDGNHRAQGDLPQRAHHALTYAQVSLGIERTAKNVPPRARSRARLRPMLGRNRGRQLPTTTSTSSSSGGGARGGGAIAGTPRWRDRAPPRNPLPAVRASPRPAPADDPRRALRRRVPARRACRCSCPPAPGTLTPSEPAKPVTNRRLAGDP